MEVTSKKTARSSGADGSHMLHSVISGELNSLLAPGGILFAFVITVYATAKAADYLPRMQAGNTPMMASFRRGNPEVPESFSCWLSWRQRFYLRL